jgi:hypothetical protein
MEAGLRVPTKVGILSNVHSQVKLKSTRPLRMTLSSAKISVLPSHISLILNTKQATVNLSHSHQVPIISALSNSWRHLLMLSGIESLKMLRTLFMSCPSCRWLKPKRNLGWFNLITQNHLAGLLSRKSSRTRARQC